MMSKHKQIKSSLLSEYSDAGMRGVVFICQNILSAAAEGLILKLLNILSNFYLQGKNQLCSWKVEELTIYLGIDPKRSPPTK